LNDLRLKLTLKYGFVQIILQGIEIGQICNERWYRTIQLVPSNITAKTSRVSIKQNGPNDS